MADVDRCRSRASDHAFGAWLLGSRLTLTQDQKLTEVFIFLGLVLGLVFHYLSLVKFEIVPTQDFRTNKK